MLTHTNRNCFQRETILQFTILFFIQTIFVSISFAQKDDVGELAKKFANPISSLISVPIQNSNDYGIGAHNGAKNTTNLQPVVPITLSPKLNLITRYIVPIVVQYDITGDDTKQTGIADALVSGFLSPSETKNGFIWGAGAAFSLPIATDDYLGTKQLGLGPTAVALRQINGWTYGALANQIWSSSSDENKKAMNQFYFQPFLSYNFKSGASIGGNNEINFNWASNSTTAFLHLYINGITKIGKQTILLGGGPRICYEAPAGSKPDFGLRALLVFMFPK